jgi:hypothetical protein
MKKTALTTLCLLATLNLVLSLNISARQIAVQQDARAEKSKGGDSLESSLALLEQGLKNTVANDFRQWDTRKTYVRLKRRGGCNIGLQVSLVPGSRYVNQNNKPGPDLSLAEWRVNLSDMDAAAVRIERAVRGDYSVIRFATMGGKESIKWTGFGVQSAGWKSEGQIHVGEKDAPQVAAALEQAIIACRE